MNSKDYTGFKEATSEEMEQLIDKAGRCRTESLFTEVIQPNSRKKYDPLYSLKCHDSRGLPSAYLIYMASIDETDAAMKLVGSLHHWRKLTKLKWFMKGRPGTGYEGLDSWREDMALRDQSESKRVLIQLCKEDNVTAARALDKLSKEGRVQAPKQVAPKEEKEDADIVDILSRHKGA